MLVILTGFSIITFDTVIFFTGIIKYGTLSRAEHRKWTVIEYTAVAPKLFFNVRFKVWFVDASRVFN